MRITRCTPDDLDDLVWIARKTFRETFAGQNTAKDMAAYLASAFSPEKLAAELRCSSRGSWARRSAISSSTAAGRRPSIRWKTLRRFSASMCSPGQKAAASALN